MFIMSRFYVGSKGGRRVGLTTMPSFACRFSTNSGRISLLDPEGLVQACIGIVLPLPYELFRIGNIHAQKIVWRKSFLKTKEPKVV